MLDVVNYWSPEDLANLAPVPVFLAESKGTAMAEDFIEQLKEQIIQYQSMLEPLESGKLRIGEFSPWLAVDRPDQSANRRHQAYNRDAPILPVSEERTHGYTQERRQARSHTALSAVHGRANYECFLSRQKTGCSEVRCPPMAQSLPPRRPARLTYGVSGRNIKLSFVLTGLSDARNKAREMSQLGHSQHWPRSCAVAACTHRSIHRVLPAPSAAHRP